jgi:hypothetical protein
MAVSASEILRLQSEPCAIRGQDAGMILVLNNDDRDRIGHPDKSPAASDLHAFAVLDRHEIAARQTFALILIRFWRVWAP